MTSDREKTGLRVLRQRVAEIMSCDVHTATADTPIRDVARLMGEHQISSVPIVDNGQLLGLVTEADITSRVVAPGRSVDDAVSQIMTRKLFTVKPADTVFDVLNLITVRRIAHVPVVLDDQLVGIVTQTDLVRLQTASPVYLINDIARAPSAEAIATLVGQLPALLVSLVDAGTDAVETGHMMSAVADAATRRLIALAHEQLGDAPVPYVWLACGSQGRREQTGVSDQDNCLLIDDGFEAAEHTAWFAALARFVSDGLDQAGYVYCPGDMMATHTSWCQPRRVWEGYFNTWIHKPGPTAQLLASVMFDLRPISGDASLYEPLQQRVLEEAHNNSIFIAHMAGHALAHRPVLGWFGRLKGESRGRHKGLIDLKRHGSAPIIELARVQGFATRCRDVGTVARLQASVAAAGREGRRGIVSSTGADDLAAAYEYITMTRLRHQADQIRSGVAPDNYLDPRTLSARQRKLLREAFGSVSTVQSSLSSRFATLGR